MSLRSMRRRSWAASLAGLLAACASSDVTMTRRAPADVARPERVQVRNFAVTLDDVELDSGVGPSIVRGAM